MVRLMVIAGKNAKGIGDFLKQKGSFEVTNVFSSITANLDEIQNKIIKVEKTLYLYQPDNNIDIKRDMQNLKNLLQDGGFFDPGEIIFMIQEGQNVRQAVDYFNTVMKDVNYRKFQIKRHSPENMNYSTVYESLLGITESKNDRNTYRKLYRVERSSETSMAFSSSNDIDLHIEPFDYSKLVTHEEMKNNVVRADVGTIYRDTETALEKFTKPDLGELQVEPYLKPIDISLVTGENKSGVSTWTNILASSAKSDGKTVLIIDYSDNTDILTLLKNAMIPADEVSMLSLVRNTPVDNGSLHVCSVKNEFEEQIKMDLLLNLFYKKALSFDTILIVSPLKLLEDLVQLLTDRLTRLCFCFNPISSDMKILYQYYAYFEKLNTFLVLNESIQLNAMSGYVSAEKIKEVLPESTHIIKHKFYDTYNVGAKIFNVVSNI